MSFVLLAPFRRGGFLLALLLALAAPARAGVFFVDDAADAADALPGDGLCATTAGACTLRAAVMESNALEGRDEIDVPAGAFVLAGTGAGDAALEITEGVVIRGAGRDATVVDANGQGGVVWAAPFAFVDRDVFLADVTLRGAAGAPAVFALGHLHVDRVAIRDNADAGVRMQHFFDVMEINDAVVADNGGIGVDFAADAGGAIRDSVVERNAGAGVAIGSDTFPTIQRSAIRGNRDGGIRISCGSPCGASVEQSLVAHNESAEGAGGIEMVGYAASLFVQDSTISNNRGAVGGGIAFADWMWDGSGDGAWIEGSTIADNQASVRGGGIASTELGPFPATAMISLVNSIVARNDAPIGPDCDADGFAAPALQSHGHNLIGVACAAYAAQPTDLAGSAEAPLDPGLAPLGSYGGPTDTHALLPSSPALDAGSPEPLGANATACTPADQRGVSRDGDGDGDGVARCDVGAYEMREPCSDLLDNDGDGALDAADAGCIDPSRRRENPACQNGLDDDGDGAIDFDGGAAANGGVALASADAECLGMPGRDDEARLPACGFGAEVALALAALRRSARRATRP